MNKFCKSILALALAICGANLVQAQQMPQLPNLPLDSAVVTGTLPNGLTYFIRHNEYPKGQADFYIAQKVGSVLEDDNQRGLAHFLEHMCFNGTKNFPGNKLISWLESIGVKFGAQLNAYTGTDETVYNITNVPTANTAVTDSCLLILHDWANELLLDPEEIDKERKVIHEEWRSRNSGQQRILEEALPTLYPGSKYAYRMPIGTMDVVDNFPYQALRDYYEKWYRPDLQGIIVVGDIDVARTEAKIKEMFADIEMPENAAPRTIEPVPDTPGTLYAIGSDVEQQIPLIYIMWKFEPLPREYRNTPIYLQMDYVTSIVSAMLNERLQDMMTRPDAPFAVAQASIGNYLVANTKDMVALIGVAKEGDINPTAATLYRELLRARDGGFTQAEYDRARDNFLASLEQAYNNRNNQETGHLTQAYIRHFLDNVPALDIADLYPAIKQMAQMIPVEAVNSWLPEVITADNRAVMVMMPQTEGYTLPTKEQLAQTLADVDAEEIAAFEDNARKDPFIAKLPKAGKIKSEQPLTQWGATQWTLSNGVKVIYKQTKFKDDEIQFCAVAPQGLSRDLSIASPADFVCYDEMGGAYSIGTYTPTDIQKYFAGKQISLSPSFGFNSRSISGSATPKDIPSFMELLYGYFTAANYDPAEFAALKSRYEGLLKNQEASPDFIFGVDLQKAIFASPYCQTMTSTELAACTREGIEAITKSQLTNAADFTFIFVGNVDPETLRPLVCQYIATLPAKAAKASRPIAEANPELAIIPGEGVDVFTTPMQTPQTYCAIIESATIPFSSRSEKVASIAGQILSARLLKTVREEMGAVYSIFANCGQNPLGPRNVVLQSAFPMNPAQREEVLAVIKSEIEAMTTNVTEEEISKVKEYMAKQYTENLERNGSWLRALTTWSSTADHVDTLQGAVEIVNSITTADVQEFMKEMNLQGNYRVVVLNPED